MLWVSGMSQWLANLYSYVAMLVNTFRRDRGAHPLYLSHNVCFLQKKDKQFRNQMQQCEFFVVKFRCIINPLTLLNTLGCIYITCFNVKNLCLFPPTQCIYVFHVILAANHSEGAMFFMWVRNWIYKYGLIYVNPQLHSVKTVAGVWLWNVPFYAMKITNLRFLTCVQRFLLLMWWESPDILILNTVKQAACRGCDTV